MNDQQISSLLEQQRINQQLQTELINLEQRIYTTLDPKFLQARLIQLQDQQKLLESEIKSLQRIVEAAKNDWTDRRHYEGLQVFFDLYAYPSNL